MKCLNCGSTTYREFRQCPLHQGQAVCIGCCHSCRYYSYDIYSPACRFHIENPQDNIEKQIENLTQKITAAEDEVRRLYRYNKPKDAANLEMKIRKLVYERRQIERNI